MIEYNTKLRVAAGCNKSDNTLNKNELNTNTTSNRNIRYNSNSSITTCSFGDAAPKLTHVRLLSRSRIRAFETFELFVPSFSA